MAKRRSKKKELTPTQIEYRKQRRRIQNFISRASKRGYIFPENILPSIPKRITKASVSRLGKLTPEQMYKKAQYGGAETFGEIVPASEGLKLEKKARASKAAETRKKRKKAKKEAKKKQQQYPKPEEPKKKPKKKLNTDTGFFTKATIGLFLQTLNTCQNGSAYSMLSAWFAKLRADNGDDAVAMMLEDGAFNGYELSWETVYNVDKATDFVQGIIQYLGTQGDFYRDEIEDYWNFISNVENAMYEDTSFDTYE